MTGIWSDLVDLVLPVDCAGCQRSGTPLRRGVCDGCVDLLAGLRAAPTRPVPAPAGLPACWTLGPYEGPLRNALLQYKERGRHALAVPLGRLLAQAVAAAAGGPRPLLVVAVPSTSRAVRERYGDHMARLCRHAVRRLRAGGWSVTVARPLRAVGRPDSTSMDSAGRLAAASGAFGLPAGRVPALRNAARGRTVVVVDDVLTTGATLAAVSRLLVGAQVEVAAAAVLAATVRRNA